MTFRPTTIERAYQLAGSGSCRTLEDIKVALKNEGYFSIQDHLHGLTITRALRKLCDGAYSAAETDAV